MSALPTVMFSLLWDVINFDRNIFVVCLEIKLICAISEGNLMCLLGESDMQVGHGNMYIVWYK